MEENVKQHFEPGEGLSEKYKILPVIQAFLDQIGISWQMGEIDHPTFLPGIEVVHGTLLIDIARLQHVGDVLHEAGHIAVTSSKDRERLVGNIDASVEKNVSPELGAVAWSYAAAIHLGISPRVVFHPHGYGGDAEMLVEQFAQGRTMGQPLLAWMGMCAWRGIPAHLPEFPQMTNWLRD